MIASAFREPVPDAIAAALAILCAHYNRELDQDVARSYARKLQQRGALSSYLLEPTVDRILESRTFFPTLHEFLEDLEAVRSELLALNPHKPCPACESNHDWIETVAEGELNARWLGKFLTVKTREAPRLTRCQCYAAWREGLNAKSLLTLPTPVSERLYHDTGDGLAGVGSSSVAAQLSGSRDDADMGRRLKKIAGGKR